MKVFISWSGVRSRHLAECLRTWLPRVLQSLRPWMSEEDISAGSRWFSEVSKELCDTSAGILCVTPENQHNTWLIFEAGALSKTVDQTFLCPVLYDLSASQLNSPLAQFQSLPFDREGISKLVINLNKIYKSSNIDSSDLEEIFDVWWPRLEERLAGIPDVNEQNISRRTIDDILEEIVENTREQLRRENIRLQYSQHIDQKFEELFPLMERMGSAAIDLEGKIKRKQADITNIFDLLPREIQDCFHDAGYEVGDTNFSQMEKLILTMKNMHDQSNLVKKHLLEPQPTQTVKHEE